jgi:hypothetical protein
MIHHLTVPVAEARIADLHDHTGPRAERAALSGPIGAPRDRAWIDGILRLCRSRWLNRRAA